ncbi:SDR family NAD(P)-dependent oxidoreductase [Pseudonocardia xishanensis]|uniref:SDR family NAD(P)-dependent oxidoreductase n=1 Tax=Pseudonocardia xishanensis TaxID=630995 RepID=UPI003CD0C36B
MTGASRGFGTAHAAAPTASDKVVATAREPRAVADAFPEAAGRLRALPLDVTVENETTNAVTSAVKRFERTDRLVDNAGYGVFGSIEETPVDTVRAFFDTDVLRFLNVTPAVLPVMRSNAPGTSSTCAPARVSPPESELACAHGAVKSGVSSPVRAGRVRPADPRRRRTSPRSHR